MKNLHKKVLSFVSSRRLENNPFISRMFQPLGQTQTFTVRARQMMHDFYSDRSHTRLLRIDCDFSDSYLIGHAHRVGLAGEHAAKATLERLLPAIRNDISNEIDQIRDAGFVRHWTVSERGPESDNALAVSQFLDVPVETALEVVRTPYLFAD